MGATFLHAENEYSDQIMRMRRGMGVGVESSLGMFSYIEAHMFLLIRKSEQKIT